MLTAFFKLRLTYLAPFSTTLYKNFTSQVLVSYWDPFERQGLIAPSK